MNYFWGNVFDYFKDRRSAGTLYAMLLIVVGLLVAGLILWQVLGDRLIFALPVVGMIFVVWVWRSVARALARRRDRYKISPLSRDELRKARSKLMRAKQ